MAGLIHLELLTDFFNKIGPKRTCRGHPPMSALGGVKPTLGRVLINPLVRCLC
jgi:hypothetical protein